MASSESTQVPSATSKPDTKVPDSSVVASEEGDLMTDLSPMRTHEQSGHSASIADKMCHLVDESDDEDGEREADVNHEKLQRKELRRQQTSDKADRMRDRLKRTVSKSAS